MRFPIDVVFLNECGFPHEIRRAVRPGRVVRCKEAQAVIETKAGDGEQCFIARLPEL